MENTLVKLFEDKASGLLNIYCTAGFPTLQSTTEIILALQEAGADMIEIGIPYSDPIADGPVIQRSNEIALSNGMNLSLLFEQLRSIKEKLTLPLILMGYMNPVLQYGMENFCRDAKEAGVSAVILPDMPHYEFEKNYEEIFERYGLSFCFLVSPSSSEKRIKKADELSSGFLYAVSSSATTGTQNIAEDKTAYFQKLTSLKLHNKIMIGFGIKDHAGFAEACQYAAGGIIGTAFIDHIKNATDISVSTHSFIKAIRGN